MTDESHTTRRTMLRTAGALALAGAVAGCTSGGSTGDDPGEEPTDSPTPTDEPAQDGDAADFGGWFDDVGNYDGVVDATGKSEVTVEVGTEANGGGFGFGPAAVRVSTGTTVVWTWTGKGSSHNVVASDGAFESEMYDDEGATFERTFSEAATHRYYCQPHKTMGMKGAVVVE